MQRTKAGWRMYAPLTGSQAIAWAMVNCLLLSEPMLNHGWLDLENNEKWKVDFNSTNVRENIVCKISAILFRR